MRFLPTGEQTDFVRSVRGLLAASDTPTAVRAWAAGDHGPGLAIWSRLAGTGLFALAAPEPYGGAGPLPVELSLALVECGRAGVPGPLVETAAVAVLLSELADEPLARQFLPDLVTGETLATLTLPDGGPYALDADAATHCFTVSPTGALRRTDGAPLAPLDAGDGDSEGGVLRSTDPARRLSRPAPGGELLATGPRVTAAAGAAGRWARLLTAAQCLGVGEELLARTVEHTKRRTQFGVPIGSFQAVKHRLADTLLGLEFARPLVWAAALSTEPGDIAAAKLTAGEAAYAAARSALQLHGAVGYTEELDLSLWLRKARPLRDAWGTPSACRAEVLRSRERQP
ncbi:acyl-CoA dehydrogenase family protein [Streptomyces sp. NPDC051567]|uniref:acyl-CoA dehydrogenase family protein n=1 Tax=Streptomyces sp. NPDC051567 TaxID=3365660 RepID=UPI00379F89F0